MSTPFSAHLFWGQVAALRDALESGATARLTPEEHAHLTAAVALLRYLDAEKCFDAVETVQATMRSLDVTDDDASAPLVVQ